jgi:lactate dehydrogenase-like 2-hydroxyacid dehydrogenase
VLVISEREADMVDLRKLFETRLGAPIVEAKFHFDKPSTMDKSRLAAAEIILADPPTIAPLLELATSLKWMQSTYAGVDALFKLSGRRDYDCTRVSGVFGQQITEYVMGWFLALKRGIFVTSRQQQARLLIVNTLNWTPTCSPINLIDLLAGEEMGRGYPGTKAVLNDAWSSRRRQHRSARGALGAGVRHAYCRVQARDANSGGPARVPQDPLAPRRGPLKPSPDR